MTDLTDLGIHRTQDEGRATSLGLRPAFTSPKSAGRNAAGHAPQHDAAALSRAGLMVTHRPCSITNS